MPTALLDFLEYTLSTKGNLWDFSKVQGIAGRTTPEIVFSNRSFLLQGDIKFLWAEWFLESLCDPDRYLSSYKISKGHPHIFKEVYKSVKQIFPLSHIDEIKALSSKLTKILINEIERRQCIKRTSFSLDLRESLLEISGSVPRCGICGYKFSDMAINKFLGSSVSDFDKTKYFVDFLKPHGLNSRDSNIEIDHVLPVSLGGQELDNLKLACGWCNLAKGASMSIYDHIRTTSYIEHPKMGRISIPRREWIVRLIALKGRCEASQECHSNSKNSELTVYPLNIHGAMNPNNLRITCPEHDPIKNIRLVASSTFD